MDYLLKIINTIILLIFCVSLLFINDKFTNRFNDLQREIALLKSEVTVVKDILILIIELAHEDDKGEK